MEEKEQQSTPVVSTDDRNIALLVHLGTLFGVFLVPLIVWLVKKDESEFVAEHAKESLNFQISLILYIMASAILVFIIIGIFLLFAIIILSLVTVILASVAASKGEMYKYPLCIRFIK
jgi:uncharacterized protein